MYYDAARFYGVGELERLLRSIGGEKAHIVWHTTLFTRGWPWKRSALPWGEFIGLALLTPGDSSIERCVYRAKRRISDGQNGLGIGAEPSDPG